MYDSNEKAISVAKNRFFHSDLNRYDRLALNKSDVA